MVEVYFIILAAIYSIPLSVLNSQADSKNIGTMIIYILSTFLWEIILAVITVLFIPPFLNMLKEACVTGKAEFKTMLRGIKYAGKFFLAILLFLVIFIFLSIILLILLAPMLALMTSVAQNDTYMYLLLSKMICSFAMVFVLPFLMLWLPALFYEDYGVIDCFKCGLKKVRGNYWELVLAAIALISPSYISTVCQLITSNQNFAVSYTSPSFWIMLIISIIASLTSLIYLFLLYADIKKKESAA